MQLGDNTTYHVTDNRILLSRQPEKRKAKIKRMETLAKKLSLKLILGCALTLTSSSPRVKKYELFILSSFGGGGKYLWVRGNEIILFQQEKGASGQPLWSDKVF